MVISILFGCLCLSEKKSLQRIRTELEMTKKTAADFKANVEAAISKQNSQLAQDSQNVR